MDKNFSSKCWINKDNKNKNKRMKTKMKILTAKLWMKPSLLG
jgi:hypothetical protein